MKDKNTHTDWKRNLVLLAKNTFVWLHQLSKKYGYQITTLDQIPLEELEEISELGITGIWLIGIWERSPASKKIKELYGFNNAAASAYSIHEYRISEALGGKCSYEIFHKNAQKVGLKIGCDMVPNHTGIDSPWLINHPDWFIEADENPKNYFVYNSPNLSSDDSVEIRIEEGYYTQTGAAEVFVYKQQQNGKIRYIYHGNDGTSMPWNDTAQLNYLVPAVRKAVQKKILSVAANFDFIRLDAAMTLTKQHFKRLWYPGDDGQRCIPTRETYKMSSSDFDSQMKREFWSEVIEAILDNEPDTLLIAEAFWLMEGFFIKYIGMDRVYNSAFMNMLKNEDNRKFKNTLQEMISFTSNAMKHLVNYQTTPDEESAKNQFGDGDKYFGICTLLSTLPGLPMFGHGQFEGYCEKYGMDYLVPHMDESSDPELVEKHRQLITPLLKNRELFSSAKYFQLQELISNNGKKIDDVIAYTNKSEHSLSLVIYNNSAVSHSGKLSLKNLIGKGQEPKLRNLQMENEQIEHTINVKAEEIYFKLLPYEAQVYLLE